MKPGSTTDRSQPGADPGRRWLDRGVKALFGGLALLALWLALPGWFDRGAPPAESSLGSQQVDRTLASRPLRAGPGADRAERAPAAATRAATRPGRAAAAGRGALRIEVVWAEDATPAPGVPIRIVPVGVADSRLHEREGYTDAAGMLRVEDLPAGNYAPETCFGGSTEAMVAAGHEARARIAIPVGAVVRGQVVDEAERPVAGAAIWLSYGAFRLIGAEVACSDAHGAFALRSVTCAPLRYLGARGAGYSPSASALLAAAAATTVEVRLTLARASGEIRGRVVSRRGEAQAHALVVIGSDSLRESRLADGARAAAPPPIRARTDARGGFRVACAPSGHTPVLVRAPGFAPWRHEVDLSQGGVVELEVELDPGVQLVGTVRGAGHLPVGGAEIRIGDWDDPAGSFVRSAADGSYRLDAVGPGEIAVSAVSRSDGRASARLVAIPGEVVRWDPVLARGIPVAIRVVDERAAPLVGWTVEVGATIEGAWESRWGPTGADGRFTAPDWPEVAGVLRVTEPGASFAALQLEGLRLGTAETVVQVPDALRATGSIFGTVGDADGRPLGGVQVSASRARDPVARTAVSEPLTGRFRLDRVPAGEYTLRLRHSGHPLLAVGPYALAAGAAWDVGQQRFDTPGRLVLRLHRDDGAPVGTPGLHCRKLGSPAYDELEPDRFGVARSAPLAPGSYLLYVYGDCVVSMTRRLEIVAGQETTLALELRAGVHVRLRIVDPAAATLPIEAMRFSMLDRDGAVAAEVDLTRRLPAPFLWSVGLAAGEYRLQATTADGVVHVSARLVLADTPGQPREIEIRMH